MLPKLVVYRLLEPVRRSPSRCTSICREDKPEPLLAELAIHKLDLVLADSPVGASTSVRAFHHLLGECGVTLLREAAARGALPQEVSGVARRCAAAAARRGQHAATLARAVVRRARASGPNVVSEFEDGALLKAFGAAGAGIFPAAAVIEDEVRKQYGVQVVGRIEAVRERFYAVSHERRLKHPAVVAVCEAAREKLFG